MMEKSNSYVKGKLPFTGFYDWFLEDCEDMFYNEVRNCLERHGYEGIDEMLQQWFRDHWDERFFDYGECCTEFAKEHVRQCNEILGTHMQFAGLWSPPEYNFYNDEVEVLIPADEFKALHRWIHGEGYEKAKPCIEEWLKPRSGFIPYHSNDIDAAEWKSLDWDPPKTSLAFQVKLMDEAGSESGDNMVEWLRQLVLEDFDYPFTEEEIESAAKKALGHDFLK